LLLFVLPVKSLTIKTVTVFHLFQTIYQSGVSDPWQNVFCMTDFAARPLWDCVVSDLASHIEISIDQGIAILIGISQ
jgi:hypothetical protein